MKAAMYKKIIIHFVFSFFFFSQISTLVFATPLSEPHRINLDLSHYIPVISAEISKKNINLLFDTGATTSLILKEEILQKLPDIKKTNKIKKYIDAAGKITTLDENIIPEIQFKSLTLLHVLTYPYHPWGLKFTNEVKGSDKKIGSINQSFLQSQDGVVGIEMFLNKKIIIDYQKNQLLVFVGENLPSPYNLRKWNKTNFKLTSEGLTVTGKIENLKDSKFILDTGATISIMHANTLKTFTKKSIQTNIIFGDFKIKDHFFQIANFQEPKADAILGYNFFAEAVVYIDLINENLYFS